MQGQRDRGWRPLHPIWRALLISLGTAALVIGFIGIFVPGLPTTPFLLIASGCYVRSSERLYRWLTSRPWYRESVSPLIEQRALPLKTKIVALVLGWSMLGYLALFVVEDLALKVLILVVALIKTSVIVSLKTVR
ncbi:MAG: YbaN family protein [Blastocatellia bacterium]|nr:YbaN family protein [Blastocatellia bacterium]MCS7157923.1 YbaN family protein [Blastocatellia bacterium]MCX7753586.1 YbaN family protein [Blastocatellia bacterium]MDW8167997.1 YbaN family protein [Acidobacteriota bacterium]MDW8257050.1 YbaN family protein [Acidobacteriota bacterium]